MTTVHHNRHGTHLDLHYPTNKLHLDIYSVTRTALNEAEKHPILISLFIQCGVIFENHDMLNCFPPKGEILTHDNAKHKLISS